MRVLVLAAALSLISFGSARAEDVAPVASVTISAEPQRCPAWRGDAESARKHLEKCSSISTSAGIGRGNARSLESQAFLALYNSPRSGDAFCALYEKGTTAGKFWALLGLHFLKDAREKNLVQDFMKGDRGTIGRFLGGCEGDEVDAKRELETWFAAIDAGRMKGLIAEKP